MNTTRKKVRQDSEEMLTLDRLHQQVEISSTKDGRQTQRRIAWKSKLFGLSNSLSTLPFLLHHPLGEGNIKDDVKEKTVLQMGLIDSTAWFSGLRAE